MYASMCAFIETIMKDALLFEKLAKLLEQRRDDPKGLFLEIAAFAGELGFEVAEEEVSAFLAGMRTGEVTASADPKAAGCIGIAALETFKGSLNRRQMLQ